MADKTDAEIVTALRAAIYALSVSGMTSYTIDGQSVTKDNLPALKETLDYFERRITKASRKRVSYANLMAD